MVLINESMARRFWAGADPVGKSIQVGKTERRIVGVVETAGMSISTKPRSLT